MRLKIKLLIILLTLWTGWWGYEKFTGDFRLVNLTYEVVSPYQEAPLTDSQRETFRQILSQPFTWLGQGRQIFAFVSADQKYVLKLFKFKRLKPSFWRDYLCHVPGFRGYCDEQERVRLLRLKKLFRGYYVAYTQDAAHTGMLFVHLNPTQDLKTQVQVTDRLGLTHTIHLDDVRFAVQERGRKTKDVLHELFAAGKVELATLYLKRLLEMHVAEYQQGVIDRDHNVMYNTGFVGDRPMRIDVGQLRSDEMAKDTEVYKKDLSSIIKKRLTPWLRANYPTFEPAITQQLESLVIEVF